MEITEVSIAKLSNEEALFFRKLLGKLNDSWMRDNGFSPTEIRLSDQMYIEFTNKGL